ncbi:uncharacterized protein LOC133916689 [Phragmites australis]|uniref:uncharacterized protein LOC133916689 n=1 Tax=Phragmites australis TaxID=29695 RepID=UPI002D7912F0|nr:uncharacterized protein LOC133916689 [Phragmites australis]
MGGGGGGGGSSSDDDGDAAWKAAIDSIASVGFGVPSSNGAAKAASGCSGEASHGVELEQPREGKRQTPGLKLYQIKVRNMLDDMLEKNLEVVKATCSNLTDPTETEGGIKLFKKAPPGIKMDSMDKLHVQLRRPRILPGQEVDEKSKKFRHMLRSVVVEGNDILVSAKKASRRSLARLEEREAAAKAKAKREEERVRELKKVRGEKWLPSIARQIKEEKAWEQRWC